jgi:hypothetical protein
MYERALRRPFLFWSYVRTGRVDGFPVHAFKQCKL